MPARISHEGARKLRQCPAAPSSSRYVDRQHSASSGSSRSRRRAFCASLLARDGSSCTSRKIRQRRLRRRRMPAVWYARAGGDGAVTGARQLEAVRDVEDDRNACSRIIGNARMSTTRL